MAALEITPDALLAEAGQLALENRMLLRRIGELENELAKVAALLAEVRAPVNRAGENGSAISPGGPDPVGGAGFPVEVRPGASAEPVPRVHGRRRSAGQVAAVGEPAVQTVPHVPDRSSGPAGGGGGE